MVTAFPFPKVRNMAQSSIREMRSGSFRPPERPFVPSLKHRVESSKSSAIIQVWWFRQSSTVRYPDTSRRIQVGGAAHIFIHGTSVNCALVCSSHWLHLYNSNVTKEMIGITGRAPTSRETLLLLESSRFWPSSLPPFSSNTRVSSSSAMPVGKPPMSFSVVAL